MADAVQNNLSAREVFSNYIDAVTQELGGTGEFIIANLAAIFPENAGFGDVIEQNKIDNRLN